MTEQPPKEDHACCNPKCKGQWLATCFCCHRTDHVCGKPNAIVGMTTDGFGEDCVRLRTINYRLGVGGEPVNGFATECDLATCQVCRPTSAVQVPTPDEVKLTAVAVFAEVHKYGEVAAGVRIGFDDFHETISTEEARAFAACIIAAAEYAERDGGITIVKDLP